MKETFFKYDVGLSFAGEQRPYVEAVNTELESYGIRVFYDDDKQVELWGKDLHSELHEIYRSQCKYCILFISKDYADKVWPKLERISAQERALKDKQEYILPARFDDTEIPGLPDTIAYIDLKLMLPATLAEHIREKVGNSVRREYLPPVLDRLFEILLIDNEPVIQEAVQSIAHRFLATLRRMTNEERNIVFTLFLSGCPAELPENIHINADLLHRYTEHSVPRLKQLLGGLSSLGFRCSYHEETEENSHLHGEVLGKSFRFELTWDDFSVDYDGMVSCLPVVWAMIQGATENYCEFHSMKFLERLDFSQLSFATATSESMDDGVDCYLPSL